MGAWASLPSLGKDQTDTELAWGHVWELQGESLLYGLFCLYQGGHRFFFLSFFYLFK